MGERDRDSQDKFVDFMGFALIPVNGRDGKEGSGIRTIGQEIDY